MKLILCSDFHLLWDSPKARLDNVKDTQFKKLLFIFKYTRENSAYILQAGDFFDKPRSWHLLPEMIDFLMGIKNVSVSSIFGQHDTYMYSELTRSQTSLGVLEKVELINILGQKGVLIFDETKPNLDTARVFGCSFGQEIPEPDKNIFSILVIHAGIAERAIYPGQNYFDALAFLKKHKFDLILCGDIHQKFCIEYEGRFIVNTGPLIRKEASIYNFTHKPGFFVFDTETRKIEWVEIPHQDAELVLSRNHIEYEKQTKTIMDEFVSSVQNVEIDDDVFFVSNLWKFTRENKVNKNVIGLLSEITGEVNDI